MWWEPWDQQPGTSWEASSSASTSTPKPSSTSTRVIPASSATGKCTHLPRPLTCALPVYQSNPAVPSRWSGFLLCSIAMLLVIFPMFAFPKKLPPRHKRRKAKKMGSPGGISSDDDMMKEKSSGKSQNVSSSIGFGKDIKGEKPLISVLGGIPSLKSNELLIHKWPIIQSITWISRFILRGNLCWDLLF